MSWVKKYLTRRGIIADNNAAIGIGTLIMFISMIIVAGVAASVMIQTMNSLENKALEVGQDTIREVSTGLRVLQITGYKNDLNISQLGIFVRTLAGSSGVDLSEAFISISDSSKKVVLDYTSNVFSSSVSGGLFSTINSSNLSSSTYGIIVIRDYDNSCSVTTPVLNDDDLFVLMVNTTKCFSGISTRSRVTGRVVPEIGMNGVFSFTTPSAYVDNIIELQ